MDTMTRVPRSKETAQQTYNRLSRWYDLLAGASEAPARNLGLALLDAQPGERVLEIGSGTGQALAVLARAVGAQGRCVGLDLAPGMIRVAAARLAKADLRDRVRFCVADGAAPPFRTGAFDAVLMSFTLELFDTPEIPVVLQGCARLLRAGGRLCVVALSRAEMTVAVRLYEWAHTQLPQWIDCRPIPLRPLLRAAGYRTIAARRRRMWGLPVDIVLATPYDGAGTGRHAAAQPHPEKEPLSPNGLP